MNIVDHVFALIGAFVVGWHLPGFVRGFLRVVRAR